MAQLRVTGGDLKGRPLHAPRAGIRPTTGRVREALFAMLGDLSGSKVLDLYCGTGALGIEALSRGAAEATLVDTRPALARRNLEALGLAGRARVVRSEATRFLDRAPESAFDLILCDPPYGLDQRRTAKLDPLLRRALAPGGRLIVETSPKRPIEVTLPLARERSYGDTLVRLHAAEGGSR